jgi:putative sigma-54 modulation protein
MNIIVSGKNILLTDSLKNTVEKQISKLGKYFSSDINVRANLSVQVNTHIIEITIPINGVMIRAEEATDDMYKSIDYAVKKLEHQLIKYKRKLQKRDISKNFLLNDTFDESIEDSDANVVRTKRFAIKPMDIDEAILNMELLGHAFFVFRNSSSEEVNVVYKRKNESYGLIEPEI